MSRTHVSMLGLLILLWLFLGWRAAGRMAPTFDEPVHLTAGFAYWKTGDYRLNGVDHPAFVKLWAAFPLLFQDVRLDRSHILWIRPRWSSTVNQFTYADDFLYKNRISADDLIVSGRRAVLFLGIPLLLSLFWVGARLWGPTWALFGVSFCVFSPNMLGHAGLITTDFGLALFYFLFFVLFSVALRPGTHWGWWILSGVVAGLALSTKYSAVALAPAAGLVALWEWKQKRTTLFHVLLLGGSITAVALLTVGCVYQFHEWDIFWRGLDDVVRAFRGRGSFLMGRHSTTGWWYYFPFAFLIKTPIPVLLFTTTAIYFSFRKKMKLPAAFVIPPIVFLLLACTSKMNIGHRHILPIYPFLYLAAVGVLAHVRVRRSLVIAGVLVAWQIVSLVQSYPESFTFFNEFVGGPKKGYHYLADSNVDWGQGLKKLGKYLRRQDIGAFYFSYFGSADPAYEGLKVVHVASHILPQREDTATLTDLIGEKKTYFAISVTNYQHVYFVSKEVFAWLRSLEPETLIAKSILVYDLTAQGPARTALASLLMRMGKVDLAEYEREKAREGMHDR